MSALANRLVESLDELYRQQGAGAIAEVLAESADVFDRQGLPARAGQEVRDLACQALTLGREAGGPV